MKVSMTTPPEMIIRFMADGTICLENDDGSVAIWCQHHKRALRIELITADGEIVCVDNPETDTPIIWEGKPCASEPSTSSSESKPS